MCSTSFNARDLNEIWISTQPLPQKITKLEYDVSSTAEVKGVGLYYQSKNYEIIFVLWGLM